CDPVRADRFCHLLDQLPVPLRPTEVTLISSAVPLLPRGKIPDRRPGGELVSGASMVVPARVLDQPSKSWRTVALAIQPFGNADSIERRPFRVIAAARRRNVERFSPAEIARRGELFHRLLESRQLRQVLRSRAHSQVKPFVPGAFVENAFLGLGDQNLLG